MRTQAEAACEKKKAAAIAFRNLAVKKKKKKDKTGNDCLQPRALPETPPSPFEWLVGPSKPYGNAYNIQ